MLGLYLWLNVLIAFLVGGFWITLASTAADKFGSRVGGFISGLPSTAVITFLFVGITQSTEAAAQATTVLPLAYGFTALFLLTFLVLSQRGFYLGLCSALIVWVLLSLSTVLYNFNNFTYSIIGYLIILGFSHIALEKMIKSPTASNKKIEYTKLQIAIRSLFGGIIVALAVFLSKVGGVIFGGLFAAFPAVFTSTLIIAYKSQGLQFSRAMIKPMLITGMITIVTYSLGVRYSYPSLGLFWGTICALLVSLGGAYFTYRFMQKK